MSQPSVASFFNTRKRAAADEINITRNKVFVGTAGSDPCETGDFEFSLVFGSNDNQLALNTFKNHSDRDDGNTNILFQKQIQNEGTSSTQIVSTTRSGRAIKRIGVSNLDVVAKSLKTDADAIPIKLQQQKLVKFTKIGSLSPRKKLTPKKDGNVANIFSSKESITNTRGMRTPTKRSIAGDDVKKISTNKDQISSMVRKELNFDEVKTKVTRSGKLQELKASLSRLKDLEKVRKQQEVKNDKLRKGEPATPKPSINLQEFKTIELEVLTSPKKGLRTPVKIVPPAPDKNELMSPKKTTPPKKLLFSPSKDGSPAKLIVPPAYQRFQNLTEAGRPSLQMPFKYRCLIETFKCLDSVCAMFYNRKEIITFKKLKPAVQRMLRKNFNETHLAQIKHIYPVAFTFAQMKMRNFGSTSKQDYYQLVIIPNVEGYEKSLMAKIDEDNVLKSAQLTTMNPQVMIDRQQKFSNILLKKVKNEHDKFLKSLDPPLVIPKEKVTRWHPEFELENCPDIEKSNLPQAPNIEKYSSAKDILSTARNLFNCATPLERAMERVEAHKNPIEDLEKKPDVTNATILKGIPNSLLEKIRAKQAAKALDAITRRPSQDQEATKYSRLPELARHLRNVFITEKKGVLTLEIVIKKIENSYRTSLTPQEIETHLRLIAKECSDWIAFHEIRKTMYLKISRDADLSKIIERLENVANIKSK